MAEKKDPTVTSRTVASDATAGAHPARPIDEADHGVSALAKSYSDAKDKPSKHTVAQVQEVPEGWPGADRSR